MRWFFTLAPCSSPLAPAGRRGWRGRTSSVRGQRGDADMDTGEDVRARSTAQYLVRRRKIEFSPGKGSERARPSHGYTGSS